MDRDFHSKEVNLSGLNVGDALKNVFLCNPDHMPEVPELRALILKEAQECQRWGADGEQVATLGQKGRVTFFVRPEGTVVVTYIPHAYRPNGWNKDWQFRAVQFQITPAEFNALCGQLREKVSNQISLVAIHAGTFRG